MHNKADKKLAEIETLRFASPGLSTIHNEVMLGYAYTKASGLSDAAIEAALFGERLTDMLSELEDYERINATTRQTQRTIIKEFELKRDISKMNSQKSSLIGRYRKAIQEYDVDFIKFTDDTEIVRYCVALCEESVGVVIDRTLAKVQRTRVREELTRKNAAVVGKRYKKVIPGTTNDDS